MKTIQCLVIALFLVNATMQSQDIPHGINDKNGKYVNTGDASIYYEVYGEGKPVVLLHGGFGYIDSFKKYIPILSKEFKVIAIASRGYGRSEIGNKKYSYDLFADDVQQVIANECRDKVTLIGFSDGAMTAYIIASKYPEIVRNVVAMGGPLGTSGYDKDGLDWLKNYTAKEFDSYRPDFKKIMPQPERWNEFNENLKLMWATPNILQPGDLRKIECPLLLLFGDRDLFCTMEHIVQIYKALPEARLAVFPNSGHGDISFRNTQILEHYILKFIE